MANVGNRRGIARPAARADLRGEPLAYDGVLGPKSWKGVQTVLTGAGYTGPIDGAPGPNTWKALQRIAQRGGYAGPVDGVPGPNTYAGLAELLVRSEHD